MLWYKHSSAAIPFGTLVALLALWFLVSVPLTFVGAFFGYRKRVRLLIIHWMYFLQPFFSRQLNSPFAQTKFLVKFRIKPFILSRSPGLLWEECYHLVAFLFNCSSFWIPFGPVKLTICLDFFSWYLSSSSLPALKQPSFYATSICALRFVVVRKI